MKGKLSRLFRQITSWFFPSRTLFERLTHTIPCPFFTPRRHGTVGQSPTSFHSLPDLPTLRPASAHCSTQRTQTRPETSAWGSHGRSRNRGPSAHSGCNNSPPVWTCIPTRRGIHLSFHPYETTHTDRLSHAGPQDRESGPHCRSHSGSSQRWVLRGAQPVTRLLNRLSVNFACVLLGAVLPVGGVLLGEPFIEPLSGRMVRVGGASIRAGALLPNSGGYQTLLDSKVLYVNHDKLHNRIDLI